MSTPLQTSPPLAVLAPLRVPLRVALLVALLIASAVPAVAPASPAATVGQPGLEARIVALTNVERQKRGLTPLEVDTSLRRAAFDHSEEMIRLDYFAHESPTAGRRTVSERALLAGCTDVEVGENIAFYQGYSLEAAAQRVVTDWMNSPGHRANILRASYTSIGLGMASGGDKIMISQEFAGHRLSFDPIEERESKGHLLVRLSGRAPGVTELGIFDDGMPLQRVIVDAKGRFSTLVRLRVSSGIHPLHFGTLVRSGRERAAFDIVSIVPVRTDRAEAP